MKIKVYSGMITFMISGFFSELPSVFIRVNEDRITEFWCCYAHSCLHTNTLPFFSMKESYHTRSRIWAVLQHEIIVSWPESSAKPTKHYYIHLAFSLSAKITHFPSTFFPYRYSDFIYCMYDIYTVDHHYTDFSPNQFPVLNIILF